MLRGLKHTLCTPGPRDSTETETELFGCLLRRYRSVVGCCGGKRGNGAERGGPERAPTPPAAALPASSQPSRPHLAAALPCFRCVQTSSGGGWRLCIWSFKHKKALPGRGESRRGGAGWEPGHALLSRAKPRRPSRIAPRSAAPRGGAGASQAATRPHAPTQPPPGDARGPGAQ